VTSKEVDGCGEEGGGATENREGCHGEIEAV
jgi:hypothetical protein